jgi:hydroxymethylpyrimidine/phosphomethylpyrimidine kinase
LEREQGGPCAADAPQHGAPLLKPDAIEVLKTKLLPLATVVTPNLHEAGALTGCEINTFVQMKEAAKAIRELGPENVVVKGGHLQKVAADVLYDGRRFMEFRGKRIDTRKYARNRLHLRLRHCGQFGQGENGSRKRNCS